ncbi:MAG: hypothetical protein ACKOE2_00705 [Actinomycetales bacterium]
MVTTGERRRALMGVLFPELLPRRVRAFGVAVGFGIGCAALSAVGTIDLPRTAGLPLPQDVP